MGEHASQPHLPESAAEWPAGALDMLRYEDILLLIGQHLDDGGAEAVTISEVETGFLVRARGDGRASDLFEFQLADLAQAVAEMLGAAGDSGAPGARPEEVPGGYAEFLRALGRRLDLRGATYIVVTEGANFLAVTGVEPTPGQESARSFEEILLPDEVAHLIQTYTPSRGSHAAAGVHTGNQRDAGGALHPDESGGIRRLFRRLRHPSG